MQAASSQLQGYEGQSHSGVALRSCFLSGSVEKDSTGGFPWKQEKVPTCHISYVLETDIGESKDQFF